MARILDRTRGNDYVECTQHRRCAKSSGRAALRSTFIDEAAAIRTLSGEQPNVCYANWPGSIPSKNVITVQDVLEKMLTTASIFLRTEVVR